MSFENVYGWIIHTTIMTLDFFHHLHRLRFRVLPCCQPATNFWQELICFLSLPFLEFYINRIIEYAVFCFFFSFSIQIWNSFRLLYISVAFFLLVLSCILLYGFVYQLINIEFFSISNKDFMNTCIHVFVTIYRNGISLSYSKFIFNFIINCKIVS